MLGPRQLLRKGQRLKCCITHMTQTLTNLIRGLIDQNMPSLSSRVPANGWKPHQPAETSPGCRHWGPQLGYLYFLELS